MHLALTPWFRLPTLCLSRPGARLRAQPATASRAAPAVLQELVQGATFAVAKPRGVTIECRSGSLWLTHDGDCKDVVLAAGQAYRSERPGRLLVHAMEAAHFAVTR